MLRRLVPFLPHDGRLKLPLFTYRHFNVVRVDNLDVAIDLVMQFAQRFADGSDHPIASEGMRGSYPTGASISFDDLCFDNGVSCAAVCVHADSPYSA